MPCPRIIIKVKAGPDVNVAFNYLTLGDAPVETPDIPRIGQVSGRYTSRDTFYIRMSLSLGAGSGH
jgi:hypothetical protein